MLLKAEHNNALACPVPNLVITPFLSIVSIKFSGRTSFAMSSKTGDLLLELEASDENIRDTWVSWSISSEHHDEERLSLILPFAHEDGHGIDRVSHRK